MKQMFEPSVDPWDLMVEHNQRIQALEKQLIVMGRLIDELSKNNESNAKSVSLLAQAHEQNLQLYLDIAGRLQPQEK